MEKRLQGMSRGLCISQHIGRFYLERALIKPPSKPSWTNFRCALFVPAFWLDSFSNDQSSYPYNRVSIYFIFPAAVVVPVPSTSLLKLFMSWRNSSGWPCSKVMLFRFYVSELALDRFQLIFILMMSYSFNSFGSFLNSRIGRGSIHACNYELSQNGKIFMILSWWYWGTADGVTRSDFSKFRTRLVRIL